MSSRAYVQLYLREEIRAEALVRNLPGFVRFLPVAALLNAQVINVAGIARDAGVARTTVQGYLDILEGHVARAPVAGVRGPRPGARAPAAQAVLGGPGARPRRQAPTW